MENFDKYRSRSPIKDNATTSRKKKRVGTDINNNEGKSKEMEDSGVKMMKTEKRSAEIQTS